MVDTLTRCVAEVSLGVPEDQMSPFFNDDRVQMEDLCIEVVGQCEE